MAKKIYIYVLTNKCFNKDNLVKIGYTDDVQRRIKDLSNTSVYSDFEVYATYEVSGDIKKPDALIHKIIDQLAPSKRLNPKREFYEMYPWEAADMLENIAELTGTSDKFVRYLNNDTGADLDEEEPVYSVDSLFGKSGQTRDLYNQVVEIAQEVCENKLIAKPQKHYVAFKKDKFHNVICLWPKDGWLEVVLNAKIGSIHDETGTAYDISNRKWTAAQYAFKFDSSSDIEIAKKLIKDTYKL